MACNLIFIHLRSRLEHADKCTARACVDGCGFERFEEWLNAPLLSSDVRHDERVRDRADALLRGEIPA